MSLPKLHFYLVNAFAREPHGGNQAAVILFPKGDPRVDDDKYYSALAKDFSLPMTAFVVPVSEEEGQWAIRWFTAIGEESHLCGHATLATAKVLFKLHNLDLVTLTSKFAGPLTATREGDAIGLSLPLGGPAKPSNDAQLRHLAACAAGITVANVDEAASFICPYGMSAVFRVSPDVDLASVKVDVDQLADRIPGHVTYTQIKSAQGNDVKINSRVFLPFANGMEDPVTGSAHAALTEYYLVGAGRDAVAAAGATADGKDITLDASQLSARGGAMKCSVVDGRAKVVGLGWITGSGELEVV